MCGRNGKSSADGNSKPPKAPGPRAGCAELARAITKQDGILTSGDCSTRNLSVPGRMSTRTVLAVPQLCGECCDSWQMCGQRSRPSERAWENKAWQRTRTQQLPGPSSSLGSQDCAVYTRSSSKRRSTEPKGFMCLKLPAAFVVQGCIVLES